MPAPRDNEGEKLARTIIDEAANTAAWVDGPTRRRIAQMIDEGAVDLPSRTNAYNRAPVTFEFDPGNAAFPNLYDALVRRHGQVTAIEHKTAANDDVFRQGVPGRPPGPPTGRDVYVDGKLLEYAEVTDFTFDPDESIDLTVQERTGAWFCRFCGTSFSNQAEAHQHTMTTDHVLQEMAPTGRKITPGSHRPVVSQPGPPAPMLEEALAAAAARGWEAKIENNDVVSVRLHTPRGALELRPGDGETWRDVFRAYGLVD